MRLLLDEHYAPEIAVELRGRGHDVVAVKERGHLIGRTDRVHFAALPEERRAIVTEGVGDYRPLLRDAMKAGTRTYGLLCVKPTAVPASTGRDRPTRRSGGSGTTPRTTISFSGAAKFGFGSDPAGRQLPTREAASPPDPPFEPTRTDAADLVAREGDEHELAYRQRSRSRGRRSSGSRASRGSTACGEASSARLSLSYTAIR